MCVMAVTLGTCSPDQLCSRQELPVVVPLRRSVVSGSECQSTSEGCNWPHPSSSALCSLPEGERSSLQLNASHTVRAEEGSQNHTTKKPVESCHGNCYDHQEDNVQHCHGDHGCTSENVNCHRSSSDCSREETCVRDDGGSRNCRCHGAGGRQSLCHGDGVEGKLCT